MDLHTDGLTSNESGPAAVQATPLEQVYKRNMSNTMIIPEGLQVLHRVQTNFRSLCHQPTPTTVTAFTESLTDANIDLWIPGEEEKNTENVSEV